MNKLQEIAQAIVQTLWDGGSPVNCKTIVNIEQALAPFIDDCPTCELHKKAEKSMDDTMRKLREDSRVDPALLNVPCDAPNSIVLSDHIVDANKKVSDHTLGIVKEIKSSSRKDKMKNQKIAITGGAGFIGSTLARMYAENNSVTIFDNLDRCSIEKEDPLWKKVHFIKIDLAEDEDGLFYSWGDSFDYVIHCAAIAGIDTVIKDPIRTMEVNFNGTQTVLRGIAGSKRLKRFINFSTSEIFGNGFGSSEDDISSIKAAGEARWVYAVSKLSAEHLTKAYFHKYGVPAITVRPFNVYGPKQTGDSAMSNFIKKAIKGETLKISGSGSQIRAWCYVSDFINALCFLIEYEDSKLIGETFNIGNDRESLSIYALAKLIIRTLSSDSKIEFVPSLSADIDLRVPSIEKLKKAIGYYPKIGLEIGIERTAKFYKTK